MHSNLPLFNLGLQVNKYSYIKFIKSYENYRRECTRKNKKIKTYTEFLAQSANNQVITNGEKQASHMYIRGTCYCKSMEKEADFYLNPEVDVRLYYPFLADLVYKEKLSIRKEFDIRVSLSYQNKEKCPIIRGYEYLISLLYNIKDITKAPVTPEEFDAYITNRRNQLARSGFAVSRHKSNICYIINVISNLQVLRKTKIIDIPCTCKKKFMFKQVLPVGLNTGKVMCYTSCLRTLFAAFKRQLKAVPRPDPKIMDEFLDFSKKFIDKYIKPHISEFDYSVSQWMNHLTSSKQQSIEQIKKDINEKGIDFLNVVFGLFCKIETQKEGGKNRAIANIDPKMKWIMGPVCWSLEAFFTQFFPGYCGNKSATDLENYLTEQYHAGFTTSAQGDGSGFDLSQHPQCKEIDKYIYSLIKDKVWHVDSSIFWKAVSMNYRKIDAKLISKEGIIRPFSSIIPGTVFSGSSDTTLMNTVRMALYNHFTLYKAHMKLNNDYKLLAKGDDFMILIHPEDERRICSAYSLLWSNKPKDPLDFDQNYGIKGIGQIIKFLKIGDYETIDFCSNAVIRYIYNNKIKFKIMRRPERMIDLAHYNRKAATYGAANLKQFYLDMATILRLTCGYKPFYRNYIDAYEYYASQIHAPPKMPKVGKMKRHYEDDGHKSFHNEKVQADIKRFKYLDKDMAILCRLSTHQDEVDDKYVYKFLEEQYQITKPIIDYHAKQLKRCNMIYDPISDMIAQED